MSQPTAHKRKKGEQPQMGKDDRTAPLAYGKLRVVCSGCRQANEVDVELGVRWWTDVRVRCSSCGHQDTLRVELGNW